MLREGKYEREKILGIGLGRLRKMRRKMRKKIEEKRSEIMEKEKNVIRKKKMKVEGGWREDKEGRNIDKGSYLERKRIESELDEKRERKRLGNGLRVEEYIEGLIVEEKKRKKKEESIKMMRNKKEMEEERNEEKEEKGKSLGNLIEELKIKEVKESLMNKKGGIEEGMIIRLMIGEERNIKDKEGMDCKENERMKMNDNNVESEGKSGINEVK